MNKKYLTGGDILGLSLQAGAGALLAPFNAVTGGALDPIQQNLNKKIGDITNQDPEILKSAEQANQVQNQVSSLGLDALKMAFKDGGSITEMFTKAYSHGGKLDYQTLEAIGVNKRQANKAYKDFITKYESGGSLMPYNSDHLAKESENLMQYDGPDHPQGGIKTPAGEFNLQETVLKAGKVSNTPYAFSDINTLDKSTAEQLGLDSKHVGKTMAEISKSIEKKYEVKFNDDDTKAKTKQLMSQDLYSRLMEANELALVKAKAKQLWDSKPNYGAMSQDEFNEYMCGGKVKEYQGGGPIEYDAEMKRRIVEDESLQPASFTEALGIQSEPFKVQDFRKGFGNYDNTPTSFNEAALGSANTEFRVNPDDWKKPITVEKEASKPDTIKKDFALTNEQIGLGLKGLAQIGEVASTLGKKQSVAVQRNPYADQVSQIVRDRYVDMTPIQDQIASAARSAYENLAGNNSQAVNTALGQGISNQQLSQLSQAKLQGQQMNNQYKGDLASTLNNLGQQDVAAKNYQENLQAQTDANVRNVRREALGNIGNDLGNYFIAKDVVNAKTAEDRAIAMQRLSLEIEKAPTLDMKKRLIESTNEMLKAAGQEPLDPKIFSVGTQK